MRSAVFYLSFRAGIDRQQIVLPDGRRVFIRAEIYDGDEGRALDCASPQPGEVVLNTYVIDE